LSVSRDTGAIAFSVFRNSAFEVHRLAEPRLVEKTMASHLGLEAEVSAVPSVGPASSDLGQQASGLAVSSLPDTAGDDTRAAGLVPVPPLAAIASQRDHASYRPRLSLEGIGAPYFSAGGGPLGNYVSGGASLLFGDLLGNHQVLTAAHISSRLDESALGAMYVNRQSRWNWGVSIEQTPDLRVRTTGAALDSTREHALIRTRERMLWTTRRLGAFASYPLSRARRVEIHGAIRGLGFSRDLRTEHVSTRTGMVFDADTQPLGSVPSIGIGETGLALVGDSTIFGATGPLVGTRYRLQANANGGALIYASVLADYRKYVMPVRPFTLALRVVHSGRYGGDASDFRLRDSYVGAPGLVRGYGARDVVNSDCPLGSADCPALNRLLANRVVAAKVELRVPLLSALTGTSRIRYGSLPVDLFTFADAGTGWGGETRFGPQDSGGRFVRSIGGGVRGNLFGLVVEASAIKPFDLRRSGWTFGVDLRPAF
jgi:hypothetical protein